MSKIKPMRLYFDTSVFGGVYDVEFEKDYSRLMAAFEAKKFQIMISDVVFEEVLGAPENVKKLVANLQKSQLFRVEVTEEVKTLRDEYLNRKILL